jgi:hypothetical protein
LHLPVDRHIDRDDYCQNDQDEHGGRGEHPTVIITRQKE